MNHNRRQFVGQCAAVVSTSAVSAMIGRMPGRGCADPAAASTGPATIGTAPQRITSATSLAQVQEFVRKHERFKVLGTRHCFNGIADSADHFLSLREMKQVVALDRAARTVTVESGMSYGQLCPYLDQQGFALHNLASLPHISIAGACATGTHGSGLKNGNLSTAVSALEIVTAGGDVLLDRAQQGSPTRFRPPSSTSAPLAWSPRSRWTCSRRSRCGRTCTWTCRWRRSESISRTSSRPATA